MIQVRNVLEHIYRRLVQDAEREGRSIAEQQVIKVLAQGLGIDADPKARRRKLLESVLAISPERTNKLTDPVRLVRGDRRR